MIEFTYKWLWIEPDGTTQEGEGRSAERMEPTAPLAAVSSGNIGFKEASI